MRKYKWLCFAMALTIFCSFFSGCASALSRLTAHEEFSFVLNGNDKLLKHEVGEEDKETGAWIGKTGVNDIDMNTVRLENRGYLVKLEELHLKPGDYMFYARMSFSSNSNSASAELHAYTLNESKDKNIILCETIIPGFDQPSVDAGYMLTIRILEGEDVSFGVYVTGQRETTLHKVGLKRLRTKENPKLSISSYYAEDERASKIMYDDSATYYFDAYTMVKDLPNFTLHYDTLSLLTAMQGIVNRDKPRLYLRYFNQIDVAPMYEFEHDLYWLNYYDKNGYIEKENVVEVKKIDTLLRIFRPFFTGVTLWDPSVPATNNAAFTDAGVNSTLPVRYNADLSGLYYHMVQELGFSVKLNLVGKFTETEAYIWDTKVPTSHSAKNDVYLWAIEKYIKTNLVNPYYLSAYDDGWIGANQYTPPLYYNENDELAFEPGEPGMPPYFKYQIYRKDVTNKDYFVSKKAFFFDLLFVESAGPVDDKNQPYGTDYATLCKILKETNERAGDTIIRVGGFTNYHTKYSLIWDLNLERGGTVEGQWGYLLTKYNAGMMADAAAISSMANASVHMNYKLPVMTQSENVNRLKQASESVKLENKNYICFQIGDFDGSTWTNNLLPLLWDDPNRGKVPIMWPISPINVERIPQVYDMMYDTASPNDVFVGSNNGFAYMHPQIYLNGEERVGLNGTLDSFGKETGEAYKKYDLDIFGHYFSDINNQTQYNSEGWKKITDMFSKFATTAMFNYYGRTDKVYDANGMLVIQRDPYNNVDNVSYRAGNGMLLVDGEQEHQVSIHSKGINVTTEKRPRFHLPTPALATPTQLYEGMQYLQKTYPDYRYEAVDPYTFCELYRKYLENCYRGDYV